MKKTIAVQSKKKEEDEIEKELEALRDHFDIERFNALFVRRGGAETSPYRPYDPDA
jgi:hypothetical protein